MNCLCYSILNLRGNTQSAEYRIVLWERQRLASSMPMTVIPEVDVEDFVTFGVNQELKFTVNFQIAVIK